MNKNKSYILMNENNVVMRIFENIDNGEINEYITYIINIHYNIVRSCMGNINTLNNNIKKWKISCIRNGNEIGYYNLNDSYEIVKSNNLIGEIYVNIKDIIRKENEDYKQQNIFINMDNNNNNNNNNYTYEDKMILKMDKKNISDSFSNIMETEEMIEYNNNINKYMRLQNNKEEEDKRKYIEDRKIYFRLKEEIKEGERKENDIPKLFENQWIVFNNIIGNSDVEKNVDEMIFEDEFYNYQILIKNINLDSVVNF